MRFSSQSSPQTLDQADPTWAWSAYEPADPSDWILEKAAHLHRRAGFGASWTQLQESLAAGCTASVERLMTGGARADTFYDQESAAIEALLGSGNSENLPAWWLHVMLHSPHPLLEKMTLFWHGHFATSAEKVTDVRLMHRQNSVLREHALGRFGPLLSAMAKDPAMLLWLDSATSRKLQPNENFAREVMELFSLGLGHYTEADIKQAARAFTGWEVRQGQFRMNNSQHDSGEKTVLGQSGRWNGDDVLGILLSQPASAEFLVGKLYRYLVSESADPPEPLVAPLADGFRSHDYDLGWLVRTILTSNLFYSPFAIRQKVKAPVEFAIGLLHALDGTASTYRLSNELRQQGQAVFFPPNVKGWDGGTTWINSSTLLSRANLVWALASGADGSYSSKVALERLPALAGIAEPAQVARRLVDLLIAAPLPDEVYVRLSAVAADRGSGGDRLRLARVVQAIATLPEFQLA